MADFGEIVKQFGKLRNEAVLSEQKGEGDYQWIQYGTPFWVYEKQFKRFESITNFLTERKKNKPTYILDIMSPGTAVRDLANMGIIDAGLSITLNDFRDPEVKTSDEKINAEVLAGNILDGTKTREVKNWIRTKSPDNPYFDLIVSDPGIGYVSFGMGKVSQGLVENIFWQGVSLLDPNGGTMLTFVPDVFYERKKVEKWIERVNGANVGLNLQYGTRYGTDDGQYILKATRNQDQNPHFDPTKKQQYKVFSENLD